MVPSGAPLLFLPGRRLISEDRGDLHHLGSPPNLRTSPGPPLDHLLGGRRAQAISGTPRTSSLLASSLDTTHRRPLNPEAEVIPMADLYFSRTILVFTYSLLQPFCRHFPPPSLLLRPPIRPLLHSLPVPSPAHLGHPPHHLSPCPVSFPLLYLFLLHTTMHTHIHPHTHPSSDQPRFSLSIVVRELQRSSKCFNRTSNYLVWCSCLLQLYRTSPFLRPWRL